MKPTVIIGAALTAGALALIANPALLTLRAAFGEGAPPETTERQEACEERDWGDMERACVVRVVTMAAPEGVLAIDGGTNGGVRVVGEARGDVRIEAEVWAASRDAQRAREILDQIELQTGGVDIGADGPEMGRRESWGVSWRVFVPTETDLDVQTHNGGISISDVEGRVRFEALNGGVRLAGLAGDVRGSTVNGGVTVALVGDRWTGPGLDVRTTNGGVELSMSEGYSAELETGTVNGRLDTELPLEVRGRINRTFRAQLGDGGAPIRATTTNGSVRIRAN